MSLNLTGLQDSNEYPITLKITGMRRGISIFGGVFALGLSVIFYTVAMNDNNPSSYLMPLFPAVIGLYILITTLRTRVILYTDRIDVQGMFQSKSARLDEIEGVRRLQSKNSIWYRLQLKEARGGISLPAELSDNADLLTWLAKLEDLDQKENHEIEAHISQDESLGSTAEERLSALQKAKNYIYMFWAAEALAAIGILAQKEPITTIASQLFILLPLLAIALVAKRPLLYTVFKRKTDPRADITIAIVAPAFSMFVFGSLDSATNILVNYQALIPYAAVTGITCVILLAKSVWENPAKFGAIYGLIFFAATYGYQSTKTMNRLLDSSAGEKYVSHVVQMREKHGKGISYYLLLEPWGPVTTHEEVNVPASVYDDLREGDPVCIVLHPGALKVQWYSLDNCGN